MKKLLIAVFAAFMVVAFAIPAIAGTWNFYGSARMQTWSTKLSEEQTGTSYDDRDTTWDLQGNSRIGANVKAGDISGRFEYGTGINLRLLYGVWNFGSGSLLVGQTYTPVNFFYSNQVYGSDANMLNVGGVYGGRNPAIQVSVQGFKLALVKPKVETVLGAADTDTTIPKIEASYSFKAGPAAIALCGGYNTFKLVDGTDHEESLDSYVLALGLSFAVGPGYVKGDVFTGKNVGNYGLWIIGSHSASGSMTDIQDVKTVGALGVVGFKVNDMLTLEAGYGYTSADSDDSSLEDDKTQAYYVQAVISPAKGVYIIPEIGKYDYKDTNKGVDEGTETYFGAKWQINF
ncbi:MAG: hypothetical protein JRJ13_05870 [Deltaproteobacteria bacterium]|nr:hypothetical protein [Deltaproteobacteria bacterium]